MWYCWGLQSQFACCCRTATTRRCFTATLQFRIALGAEGAPDALEIAPPWPLIWVSVIVETSVEALINIFLVHDAHGCCQ